MTDLLPRPDDEAWLPDPEAQWWFQQGSEWRALADVDAMVARWKEKPESVFARGGEARSRTGRSALFGCWVRPVGALGEGRWVDQDEAWFYWERGAEFWWSAAEGWVYRHVQDWMDLTLTQDPQIMDLYRNAMWGDADAQNKFGAYQYNGNGVMRDYKQAFAWFRKAAEQGHVGAQYNLGECYYYGRGVVEDNIQAVAWYLKAAEQGDADAQYSLGVCHEEGYGVEQDYEQAVAWYHKAAEQGNVNAQYNLGECYCYGSGVEQDCVQAVAWYRKAAEQGDADAQYSLGICYENGNGIEQDYKEAVTWYRKAAEQENANAQYSLGNCYYSGSGVEQDCVQALAWYRKAIKQEVAVPENTLYRAYIESSLPQDAFGVALCQHSSIPLVDVWDDAVRFAELDSLRRMAATAIRSEARWLGEESALLTLPAKYDDSQIQETVSYAVARLTGGTMISAASSRYLPSTLLKRLGEATGEHDPARCLDTALTGLEQMIRFHIDARTRNHYARAAAYWAEHAVLAKRFGQMPRQQQLFTTFTYEYHCRPALQDELHQAGIRAS